MRSKGIRHSHRLVEPKPGVINKSTADELREREAQRREAAAERMRRHRREKAWGPRGPNSS
jgi:hypothetical protein